MKKTLAILCSFAAAVAQAATTQLTLTPSLSEMTTADNSSAINATGKATDYYGSIVAPDTNVGSGGQWTWTQSFELTETMTIDSVQFALFAISSGGVAQNSNQKGGTYTLTITAAGAEAASFTVQNSFLCTQVSESNYTGAAAWTVDGVTAGTGVVVAAAETVAPTLQSGAYTLSLNIDDGVGGGTFIGLGKSVYLNGTTTSSAGAVPEPATATLSLLALAGLAARRRRK